MFALGALARANDNQPDHSNGNGQANRCGVYSSDLQLMIKSDDRYVYPDAAVVCGRPTYDRRISTAVTNPVVVVEVLSPKSEGYDTGDKYDYYATLESLRDYVLVAQDRPRLEVRSREGVGAAWTITITEGLDAAALVRPSTRPRCGRCTDWWSSGRCLKIGARPHEESVLLLPPI